MLARKVLLGLAVVLVLAVATPATAADPFKGWYGGLDLASTLPVGLDQHYANRITYHFLDPNNHEHGEEDSIDRLVMNNDSMFTWGAAFGYSWGKMGSLQVSYWGFGSNDSADGTFSGSNGAFYPTVAGYTFDVGGGYLGNYYYPVEYEAETDTSARTWDLDYIRPLAVGEKFSINWIGGLRVAQYRENRYVAAADFTDGGVDDIYIQKHRQNADGWGFKVGASANMDFTKHIGMVADLAVSFLQAQNKGDIVSCRETCAEHGAFAKDTLEGHEDNQRAEIRDYGLKAVWHQGPVDIFVGFKSSNWEGLVTDPIAPIGGGYYGIGQVGTDGRNSVAFNSWHAGVTWKIGG